MKLLGTRLLVSPIIPKPVSIGGIHLLPDNNHGEKLWRVLEVGQGVQEIQKGDAVLVGHWRMRDDMGNGNRIVTQEECLAVIRES